VSVTNVHAICLYNKKCLMLQLRLRRSVCLKIVIHTISLSLSSFDHAVDERETECAC
jgi:hypothetical protein